jgi:hypothetical protein
MTIEELRSIADQTGLKEKSGSLVVFSETGPAGMRLIHALVAVVERQQHEINELQKRLDAISR